MTPCVACTREVTGAEGDYRVIKELADGVNIVYCCKCEVWLVREAGLPGFRRRPKGLKEST